MESEPLLYSVDTLLSRDNLGSIDVSEKKSRPEKVYILGFLCLLLLEFIKVGLFFKANLMNTYVIIGSCSNILSLLFICGVQVFLVTNAQSIAHLGYYEGALSCFYLLANIIPIIQFVQGQHLQWPVIAQSFICIASLFYSIYIESSSYLPNRSTRRHGNPVIEYSLY